MQSHTYVGKRHFGESKRTHEPLAIIGHRKEDDTCVVVVLSMLPASERESLTEILLSPVAQGIDYVIDNTPEKSYLSQFPHPFINGANWEQVIFTYLVSGTNNYVMKAPLSSIIMANEEQARVFRGELDPTTYDLSKDPTKTPNVVSGKNNSNEIEELKNQVAALTAAINSIIGKERVGVSEYAPAVEEQQQDAVERPVEEVKSASVNVNENVSGANTQSVDIDWI